MRIEWTGGQYSLYRMLLGFYLFVHFAYLTPWTPELFSNAGMLPDAGSSPLLKAFPNVLGLIDTPVAVTGLCIAAAIAALMFSAGYRDRSAALFMWFVLACFFGRNPLIANPSLPYVGWMLLAHVFIPTAPYGSLAARGRTDPGGDWHMPEKIWLAAWVILAVSYSYSGYTKMFSPTWLAGENVALVLDNPLARDWFLRDLFLALPSVCLKLLTWFILILELLFALIVLSGRARPVAWAAMLFVQFGFMFLLNFPDLTVGMLLFHLLTFNPGWIPPQQKTQTAELFISGAGPVGHDFMRFLQAEDRHGRVTLPHLEQLGVQAPRYRASTNWLPDSIVLLLSDGRVLENSDAMIQCLQLLGGLWRVIGVLLQVVPKQLRDWGYRQIAQSRHKRSGLRQARAQ